MAKRIAEATREAILRDLKQSPAPSRLSLARRYSVSTTSVVSIARTGGLPVAETSAQLHQATAQRRLHARERLSVIAEKMVAESERHVDKLHEPAVVTTFSQRDGVYHSTTLPEPEPKERQALMFTATLGTKEARMIDQSLDRGSTAAKAAVVELVDRLRDKYDVDAANQRADACIALAVAAIALVPEPASREAVSLTARLAELQAPVN